MKIDMSQLDHARSFAIIFQARIELFEMNGLNLLERQLAEEGENVPLRYSAIALDSRWSDGKFLTPKPTSMNCSNVIRLAS